mmetsp:Transcript_50609/g.110438  ORF Transcript_50609/g.110438 Transcript_50609/m.110438 type:complete len:263 (+) Transcript_50609:817-1605(+)
METKEHRGIRCTGHARRHMHFGSQELSLFGRLPQEFHLPRLQVVNGSLHFQLALGNQVPDGLAELQKEVDAVENVHLDSMRCELLFAGLLPQFLVRILGDLGQSKQQSFERTGGLSSGYSSLIGQVGRGGAIDGAARGVAHDENQSASKFANAEFQTPNNAAFGMRAGVSSIAQHEEISRHCIKDRLNRSPRVGTSHDCCMWSLALVHQGLSHVLRGRGFWSTQHKALIAFFEDLQCFKWRDSGGLRGTHKSGFVLLEHGWR